jgi:catechol 2,3-dioxygenase-like lactoylglutathione lyase family enzyme
MRKFSVTGVGHTGITVSDMTRSVHFYRDVLGFECSNPVHIAGPGAGPFVGLDVAEMDIVFVRVPGHLIELLCYTKPDKRFKSQLRPCDAGMLHICLKVLNIDGVLEAMRECGIEPIDKVQTIPEGPYAGARAIYTRDPDGVHLELIQDRPGTIFEESFFGK